MGAFARQAERAVLIPVGAVLEARDRLDEARDRLGKTIRQYRTGQAPRQQFNRFERRGETAVRRYRRNAQRQVREVRRNVESRATDVQGWADDVISRTRTLA
jgi:hypothetical protein